MFNDPVCTLPVHGQPLDVPLSHALPDRLTRLPFYDRLPQRISEYLHSKGEPFSCIDVGANIGDTLAAFHLQDSDVFLAIEPNPKFNRILSANWGMNPNVRILDCLCSARSDEGTYQIRETTGTASIHSSDDGLRLSKRTLDEIVADHPAAARANVVKIDTDGYDFEVIAGARKLLSANQPALLFECADMKKPNYAEECLEALKLLEGAGYREALVYDNYGYLMGRYSLSDLRPFRNLLFYQLTSRFHYFDVLCMKDADIEAFYSKETHFFTSSVSNEAKRIAAAYAAQSQRELQ